MFIVLLFVLLNITSIYSSTQIIRVRENVNVTITCDFNRIKSELATNQLSSIPSLNKLFDNNLSDNIILWYKDDSQVIGVTTISNEPNKYSVNEINTNTYELTIINVHLESSGVYKCQNFTSKEETRFQLNVMVPPSRLRLVPSAQMPIPDGTLVSFNCTSERVYPNPMFEWYKNDKLIQRSIGNQTGSTLFSSSSILTLLLTPADHNHMLRCQVSNEASIHESNVEIKLDVLFKPIIKILYNAKELTKKLNIIENSIEVIRCQISSNPSIISNIEWLKNDQLIRGENQEQLRINFTDIKSLSCRAKNNIGQTENRIDVNVLYKPKLFMIENITLNQGENLHLKCTIDANPSCHDIRWFHNDRELLTQSCQQKKADEYDIPKSSRSHAGKYTCEVRNLLNTTFRTQQHGVSRVSTDVYLQYAPYILNSYNKVTILENSNITTECVVDAYPNANIIWFGPFGQRLNVFSKEYIINSTVISSKLELPTSYASIPGLYRCLATNIFGQHEFSIQFQRPSFPDPPTALQAINVTHSSFILQWQPGYNGGSDQIYHIILNHSHTEERFSNFNSIQFKELNEKTRYTVKIRSKNKIGFSDYSTNLVVITKESAIRSEEFPIIKKAQYSTHDRQLHYQLSPIRSMSISIDQLCIQYYNMDEISPCIPLRSMRSIDDGIKINIEQTNLRVKLCLINKTDTCSKSVPISPHTPFSNHSSEFLIILIGGVLGSFIVFGLMILFVCIHHRKYKQKSRNSSTDTLKINSDNFHSVAPVRVSNTNSCLYYPTNENRTLYFNDEAIGIYSIQDKKNSICFDSGMPSTTSDNSDSAGSQALSSSDFYDRSDGEYLVNGPRSMNKLIVSNLSAYTTVGTGRESHLNVSANQRVSSEEKSEFSTLSTSQNGKKLVYEVVV
ncbi:unnamed protein product [Rotaria socialis]|uniref:Uncharacterized protein n=1 Tax=Rotaria socialis TaxID=392032 RepID=A0A818E3S6_9BILA|nr:unnamed protein product [Rotaria socialis]CAF4289777.1 unnamed protein product [Rotaria socialis]